MNTPADHDKRCPAAWETSVKCNCGAQAADEIALIEKTLKSVGITSLLNHGAASCVFTEGCCGVSQEHILAYTREIALHCAVALGSPPEGMVGGWMPIETAPKNGTEILGYTEEVGALVLYWDSMTGEMDHWSDGRSVSFWKPTHWMPLPAAPGPADGESNV